MKNFIPSLFFIMACLFAGNNLLAQDTTCYVTMQVVQNGFCIQAVPQGNAPFTYVWEDGSTQNYFCANAFGNYCTTVTDASGCEAVACGTLGNPAQDSCDVYIMQIDTAGFALLHANASGTGILDYLWNTGENTSYIEILEEGNYCVTITDEDGCQSNACYDVIFNNMPCDLWITVDSTSAGVVLIANSNIITDDYMYFWGNANTPGAILEVTQSGTYCVTVTSASCPNGANVACTTVTLPGNQNCDVTIYDGSPNGALGLFAQASGTAPYIYVWSTGELAQSIQPAQDGSYCVTITDADGCTSDDCYFYTNPVDSCGVFITSTIGNASAILASHPNGLAPYTYLWNTGEVTPDIIVQQEAEYCVTILDAANCAATSCYYYSPFQDTSCYVYLMPVQNGFCLQAMTDGNGTYEFVWENGDVGDVFCANAWGTYCVAMIDVNTGCTSTACGTIGDPNVDSCGVFINVFENPAGAELNAVANGTAPFAYQWNTGELTESIFVANDATYCVTVTDNIGCTATSCETYYSNPIDSLCFIEAELLGSGNYALTAYGASNANVTYLWDNGATTQTITVAPWQLACVTITSFNGLSCNVCYEVPGNATNIIAGSVYTTDSLNTANSYGLAYLYAANAFGGNAALVDIDTLVFGSAGFANYYFSNIPDGDYIVQAVVFFADYAPTYHENALYWDEANIISVPDPDTPFYNIYLIPEDGLNGEGGVNGTITDGPGFTSGEEEERIMATPIEGSAVFAIDASGNVVGHAITDAEGFYEINGLTSGAYELCVDYPGIEHYCLPITIEGSATISQDFILNENGISTGTDDPAIDKSIAIYPNPVKDQLVIATKNEVTQIRVFTVTGQLVLAENEFDYTKEINVTHLEAGIYFIEISDGQQNISKRFMKL